MFCTVEEEKEKICLGPRVSYDGVRYDGRPGCAEWIPSDGGLTATSLFWLERVWTHYWSNPSSVRECTPQRLMDAASV